MAETRYRQITEKELPQKEFSYPGNRRQIGRPQDTKTELFIEDYALSFAKGLAEKDYSGCVAGVLVGEAVSCGNGIKIRVEGILEAKHVIAGDVVSFTEENWAEVYRDIRNFFPEKQIVGWFLGGPGFLLEDEERQKKIQTDNFFGEDKVLLKVDSMEREVVFLSMVNGRMLPVPGYYIFYEKNEEMQEYMMRTRRQTFVLPDYKEEMPVQKELPPVHTEAERIPVTRIYRLLYATGGVLACLIVLGIGALATEINERDRRIKLLNEQAEVVSSLCETYVVQAEDTVESICEKVYGSAEAAPVIRTINGLREKENPEPGQKILLP